MSVLCSVQEAEEDHEEEPTVQMHVEEFDGRHHVEFVQLSYNVDVFEVAWSCDNDGDVETQNTRVVLGSEDRVWVLPSNKSTVTKLFVVQGDEFPGKFVSLKFETRSACAMWTARFRCVRQLCKQRRIQFMSHTHTHTHTHKHTRFLLTFLMISMPFPCF